MSTGSLPSLQVRPLGDEPLEVLPRVRPPAPGLWSRVASRASLLLLTGLALGPMGVAVLTSGVLGLLEPAVPVALGVMGVSAALGASGAGSSSGRAAHWALGGLVALGLLTALAHRTVPEAVAVVAQASALVLLLAGAGWVLAPSGAGPDERRIFSLATFLLVGGVAEYLAVSGLPLGWVAAAGWQRWRPAPLASVRFDVAYVRHPVTAVLLIVAGARAELTWWTVAVAAGVVLLGAVLAWQLRQRGLPVDAAVRRLPVPLAVLVVALALDAARAEARLLPLLTVVVLATAALDGLLGDARRDDEEEPA